MTGPLPRPDPMTTRWSLVRDLRREPGGGRTEHARWVEAWEYLCRVYRPAMLGHVTRTLGRTGVVTPGEAEDIIQGFLLECVSKEHLLRADPRVGRFRTFVAVCLEHYTLNYVTARNAQRRRPREALLSLETLLDLADSDSADGPFCEDWARCLLASALPRVRARSARNADVIGQVIADPTLTPADLAARLGIPERQIPVRTHRARRMLAEEVWAEMKETASSPEALERERAQLAPFLSRYLTSTQAPSLYGRDGEAGGA